MPGALTDVGHVALSGILYRGAGSWVDLWASWVSCWPWRARPWSYGTSYAAGLLMERRRGGAKARAERPRSNRRRRQYLHRARMAAEHRGRDRARRWADFLRDHPGAG